MKVLLKVLLWIIGILILLVLIGFLLPKKVHVERKISIHAKPDAAYQILNDLKSYDNWMPWNQLDPNWKVEYSQQSSGTGAWYEWQSENRNVGNGRLTI